MLKRRRRLVFAAAFSIIATIFLVSVFFNPKPILEYLPDGFGKTDISRLDITIPIIGVQLEAITDVELIAEIYYILNSITVKPLLYSSYTYSPTYGTEFDIYLYNKNNSKGIHLQIMDERHVVINGKVFSITNSSGVLDLNSLLIQQGYLQGAS